MKPQMDMERALSWSQLSCFEYDNEQWYQQYVLGLRGRETPELIFGKAFADSCEIRKPLAPVTLLSEMEHEFRTKLGNIKLVGYADTFEKETRRETGEYKSGVKEWTQKRVDEHGQITLYALMNYLIDKINPEECRFFLQWIPTQKKPCDNGDFSGFDYEISFADPLRVHTFWTKRTMGDILNFAAYVKRTHKKMKEYADSHA